MEQFVQSHTASATERELKCNILKLLTLVMLGWVVLFENKNIQGALSYYILGMIYSEGITNISG